MTVQATWFITLIKRTRSKQAQTTVEWRPGLTALDVFTDEGFTAEQIKPVMVIVNDEAVDPGTALKDGDRVEFRVQLQGG